MRSEARWAGRTVLLPVTCGPATRDVTRLSDGTGSSTFVNNVVFNWVHRSSDGGDYTAMFNMINNYYKPGPATPKDTNVGHRILKPEAGRSKLDHKVYGRVYADGNIMEGYPEITKDNWNGGIQVEDSAECRRIYRT